MERELFLEIGLEELPASWLPGLNVQLVEKMKAHLATVNLKYSGTIEAFSTPRRLAVVVPQLADRQEDRDEKLMGPPVSAALTPDGQPTQALIGFAKKNNVDISGMTQEDTPKGKYFTLQRQIRGKATVDVVPDMLGAYLRDLAFPKMMHWDAELGDGKGELPFGRPIRWLLYLYGGRVVPFTISRQPLAAVSSRVQDVTTGANTYGHRFLATSGRAGRAIKVRSFDEYQKKLGEQFVIISRAERHDRIRRELEGAARKLGGHVLIKGLPQAEVLVEEVPDLIEYPTVVAGSFSPSFLELPPEVLTTTLIHHQHYFPVTDSSGRLLPHFLAVTNTQAGNDRGIAINAERVVTARLRDARFFWDSDRTFKGSDGTVGLDARLARLETVLFHKALGSYGDKATRVEALARWMATDVFKQGEQIVADAGRAAKLCKADLATDMVGEFPELQGIMGGVYAREAGEPEAVWKAIYYHYQPVGVEADAPPSAEALGAAAVTWACVSLADKIDTLAGLFKAGEKPTGSRDPFGMRRAAQGVMKILADASALGLPSCDVRDLFTHAQALFTQVAGDGTPNAFIETFMRERLMHLLERRGIRGDAARAVSGMWYAPDDALRRAEAIGAELAKPNSELGALAELYKRTANITKGVEHTAVDLSALALKEPAELALRDQLVAALASVTTSLAGGGGYPGAIKELVKLRQPVDQFFTDVMVMVDDAALKQARLELLTTLRHAIVSNIGDLSQIGTA
jgi:glycyl-tRNA synthetase beta chain